ncbi:hypothetical protein AGLY_015239, partial [Aphis glycines]
MDIRQQQCPTHSQPLHMCGGPCHLHYCHLLEWKPTCHTTTLTSPPTIIHQVVELGSCTLLELYLLPQMDQLVNVWPLKEIHSQYDHCHDYCMVMSCYQEKVFLSSHSCLAHNLRIHEHFELSTNVLNHPIINSDHFFDLLKNKVFIKKKQTKNTSQKSEQFYLVSWLTCDDDEVCVEGVVCYFLMTCLA